VVVEAAEPSGSLITARLALDLGRKVGAVPGPVTSRVSQGTNSLIVDGAWLIREAQDVLDLLLGVGMQAVRRCGPSLDPDLARVAEAVELGSGTCDAVALALGASPEATAVALARLELLGYLRADGGGRHSRTALIPPGGETEP
jgi:DNA processing protein